MVLTFLVLFLCTFSVSINADDKWSEFVAETIEAVHKYQSYILPNSNEAFFSARNNSSVNDFGTFDFIIIGGGTAGGVLANRLTEQEHSVLVIEAGKEPPAWAAVLGLSSVFHKSDWNWGYNTVPQKNACLGSKNGVCFYPRGKALGGSSIINAGMYVRGNKKDFDKWEELGNQGWSYKECLPYFKKAESAHFKDFIDEEYHGFNGPVSVGIIKDTPGLTVPILEAFREIGRPTGDYNGRNQHRASRMQYFLNNNTRASTTQAFINPARHRQNLKIVLESLVTKVVISKRIATGVEFIRNGQKYSALAKKEVIVSAGAINSPQVLMLSGIGPRTELKKHGIKLKADLPVGKHLQDHMHFPGVFFRTTQSFYDVSLEEKLELWRTNQRALMGGYNIEMVTFFDHESKGYPDIEVLGFAAKQMLADSFQMNDDYAEAFRNINDTTDFMFTIILLQPYSSGQVTLKSSDPKDYPLIDVNYFSDERDLETMYQGIKKVLKLKDTNTFKKHGIRQLLIPFPGCDETLKQLSKDWWYCALRHIAMTLYHPIGTTRMGQDSKSSVVDNNLKVHSIENLRVVDAGVMPSHISGHTNAAVVMIAEKVADIIKAAHK